MNSAQRGIYQPLADKVPLYDLADEDPEDEERSRAPLLVVVALVVLAAFAGVVWIAYNQGVERGRQGASLVITAPGGPVKVAPPETASTPPLSVYKEPVAPELEAKTSNLAPQPRPAEAPQIRLAQPAAPAAKATAPVPAATAKATTPAPAATAKAAAPASAATPAPAAAPTAKAAAPTPAQAQAARPAGAPTQI